MHEQPWEPLPSVEDIERERQASRLALIGQMHWLAGYGRGCKDNDLIQRLRYVGELLNELLGLDSPHSAMDEYRNV